MVIPLDHPLWVYTGEAVRAKIEERTYAEWIDLQGELIQPEWLDWRGWYFEPFYERLLRI